MASPAVGQVIDAPPLTPPANGLLNSAAVIENTDDPHWQNGFSFVPEGCGSAQAFNLCATSVPGGSRPRSLNPAFTPFGIYAYDECGTFGFEQADYEGRARRILAAKESAAIEAEFWTGATEAASPHLAWSGNDTAGNPHTVQLNGGTALGAVAALMALVQGIADYGLGRGMIHARPGLVTQWSRYNLLRWENGKLYTYTGSIVVPGSGYPGTSPSGGAPTGTSEWAYATELVQVMRGPVVVPTAGEIAQSLDRTNNKVRVSAQRVVSAYWNNCAVLGANVNPTT